MQRKPYFKLLMSGLQYVVFGSVLCTVMTIASAPFLGGYIAPTMRIILVIFTSVIYFSMIFLVAWKDGVKERKIVIANKSETGRDNWLSIGFVMVIFAALPSIFLLLSRLMFPSDSYFLIFKFISGPIYSWLFIMMPEKSSIITFLSPMAPMYFIVYYMLIPIFTKFGFYVGFNDKFSQDKIMYK